MHLLSAMKLIQTFENNEDDNVVLSGSRGIDRKTHNRYGIVISYIVVFHYITPTYIIESAVGPGNNFST